MEGKGRLFDRDDLDEEEKALFDQMVQEEMDKLESQFRSALPASSERDDDKESRNDAGYYQSKEISESKSMDSNARRVAPPPRISSSFVASNENVPASTGHQFTQERSHAEKIEYMRQLDQGVQQQRDSRQGGDNHHEDAYGRGGNVTRHLKSRSEITTGYPVEEDRNGARIGNIGESAGHGTPSSQKRAQQAAYAKSIADASSALEIGSGVARSSSRRQVNDDQANTEYSSHALSAIGQSSQNGKDQKKQQQMEYARQLQKQMQNNEESREKESQADGYASHHPGMSSRGNLGKRSSVGGGGGAGGGAREESAYESSYPPSPSGYCGGGVGSGPSYPSPSANEIGSVATFGADPDAEAARKRSQQQKYALQLQEQRQRDLVRKEENDARNGGGGTHRARAVTAGTTQATKHPPLTPLHTLLTPFHATSDTPLIAPSNTHSDFNTFSYFSSLTPPLPSPLHSRLIYYHSNPGASSYNDNQGSYAGGGGGGGRGYPSTADDEGYSAKYPSSYPQNLPPGDLSLARIRTLS